MKPARHIAIASSQDHGALRWRQLATELDSSGQTGAWHSVGNVGNLEGHFKSLPKCAGDGIPHIYNTFLQIVKYIAHIAHNARNPA